MKRRDFLKLSSGLTAHWVAVGVVGSSLTLRKAEAQTDLPLASLQDGLGKDDLMLVPNSAKYDAFNVAFNKRTLLAPKVRVVCSSAQAVQSAIVWAKKNGVHFSLRSGGHSYEGLSQSRELTIDLRGMSDISVDAQNHTTTVDSGCALGEIYKKLAVHNLAIPAGSCFPVGVAGHTLGGGFGLLSRPLGLACDNVISMEMVDAFGNISNVSASEDPDLFWALRGGGSGNFGVVTKFQFRASDVSNVAKFSVRWEVPVNQAVHVIDQWQQWLPSMSTQMTGTFHVEKPHAGKVELRFVGLSVGSETNVQTQLKTLSRSVGITPKISTSTMHFMNAAEIFNGTDHGYEAVIMKAKSDYVVKAMSQAGIAALLKGLDNSQIPIAIMFDTYGGAINKIPTDATAFVHRGNTAYSIQYYTQWSDTAETDKCMNEMRKLYSLMRPYVSGECYVNYCDLDLGEKYAEAYWGSNLPRLKSLKDRFDPGNVFNHAQSIPL